MNITSPDQSDQSETTQISQDTTLFVFALLAEKEERLTDKEKKRLRNRRKRQRRKERRAKQKKKNDSKSAQGLDSVNGSTSPALSRMRWRESLDDEVVLDLTPKPLCVEKPSKDEIDALVAALNSPLIPFRLPSRGDVPTDDVDILMAIWDRPNGPIYMDRHDYTDWLWKTYRWAIARLSATGEYPQVVKSLKKKSNRVKQCGDVWRYRKCTCGFKNTSRAYPMDRCKSSGCAICGRIKSQSWRFAMFEYVKDHIVQRKKGVISRDYYQDTYTRPEQPYFGISTIKEGFGQVADGAKNVWQTVAKFNPKKVGEKKYPGPMDGAGMHVSIEVGPSANLHVHAICYGGWHTVEELTTAYKKKVPEAKIFDFKALRDDERTGDNRRTIGEMIGEVCKYSHQGTTKKLGYFTHPLVVVLTEIALYHRHKIRDYGSMRGLQKRAKEIRKQERIEAEEQADGCLPGEKPCPQCGKMEWHWHTEKRDESWIPEGWNERKKKSNRKNE